MPKLYFGPKVRAQIPSLVILLESEPQNFDQSSYKACAGAYLSALMGFHHNVIWFMEVHLEMNESAFEDEEDWKGDLKIFKSDYKNGDPLRIAKALRKRFKDEFLT